MRSRVPVARTTTSETAACDRCGIEVDVTEGVLLVFAGLAFELERRVCDREAGMHDLLHAVADDLCLLEARMSRDEHVRRERTHVARETPAVQIVHAVDPGRPRNRGSEFDGID